MKNYIEIMTDSYKLTHHNMYPNDTDYVYSYFESRNGAKYNKTIFFGLQYLIKEYLAGVVVTREGIEHGAALSKVHFGNDSYFNRDMWEYILDRYDGRLPVSIRAVAEGTPVDVSNVLMTVVNTDSKCYPLTNHLETILSQIWAPSTVATLSYEVYKLISYYRDITSDNRFGIKFGLHDFGYRGTSSIESAGLLGCGHLLNFMGTDTIRAMEVALAYYSAELEGLAYSVPATEHSVMTSRGYDGEKDIFSELLDKYPTGILSIVIDSYNYKNFIGYANDFRDRILARDGKIVFRPDSGDPVSVTLDVYNMLSVVFGNTVNSKGYKELNNKVGVLWGDGIDYEGIRNILFALKNNGYSTASIVFGMGGGLLQKINRDDQRFAFKSSAQCRNGVWYDISKNPLDSSKKSKSGRLCLIKRNDRYETLRARANNDLNELREVFRNGELLIDYNFNDVRKNIGTW